MAAAAKEKYTGTSAGGFRAATEAAVAVYKERKGNPGGARVKLKVEEMYVMVENPIRDYVIVLSSTG